MRFEDAAMNPQIVFQIAEKRFDRVRVLGNVRVYENMSGIARLI